MHLRNVGGLQCVGISQPTCIGSSRLALKQSCHLACVHACAGGDADILRCCLVPSCLQRAVTELKGTTCISHHFEANAPAPDAQVKVHTMHSGCMRCVSMYICKSALNKAAYRPLLQPSRVQTFCTHIVPRLKPLTVHSCSWIVAVSTQTCVPVSIAGYVHHT